jgi:thiol-disulfide isomerase/thioredoxin
MKKLLTGIIALFLLGLGAHAQTQYESTIDKNGSKVLKGIISRELIESDSSFKWYSSNFKSYTPNSVAQSALNNFKDSIQLVVFMGTWCEDSHVIVPKFFSLLDATNFSHERLTVIGVDRSKKTLGHLAEALNVKNVPTIIALKDGKELGRVVEYGKYGMWDKELGEVINAGFSK